MHRSWGIGKCSKSYCSTDNVPRQDNNANLKLAFLKKREERIELNNLEKDLATEQGNIVSDRVVEHESRVTKAMLKADADKTLSRTGLLEEEYATSLEQAGELSPYANRMFQNILQKSKEQDFAMARKKDIEGVYAEASFALENGINAIANKIGMGQMDVEQGLNEFLTKVMSPYVKVLGYDANVKNTQTAFQTFC